MEQAETVRKLFNGYIAGLGLKPAAENAGLDIFHGSAGRMLRNMHYLGDEFYPAIIDRERFDKAEEIRIARASSLGRVRELQTASKPVVVTKFTLPLYVLWSQSLRQMGRPWHSAAEPSTEPYGGFR